VLLDDASVSVKTAETAETDDLRAPPVKVEHTLAYVALASLRRIAGAMCSG
jgi:hypothetical protein